MKQIAQYVHLSVYHTGSQDISPHIQIRAEKGLDIAVIIVSLAGLFSALLFLITMS